MSRHAPVLGKLGDVYQGGPFRTFDTGLVHGLAVREGKHLQLLVVIARYPSRGDVTALLQQLQARYDRITIWEVMADRLQAILYRLGFVLDPRPAESQHLPDHIVFEWRKPPDAPTPV